MKMKFLQVFWEDGFSKSLKRVCKKNPQFKDDFRIFFDDFFRDTSNKKYKVHKLKGKLKGYFSAKIKFDLRLIFTTEKDNLFLIDIGKQDDVYS